MKKKKVFLSENFQFLQVKFSKYLNRRVFIMFLDKNGGISTKCIHSSLSDIMCASSSWPSRGSHIQTTLFIPTLSRGGRVVRRCCVSYITGASN